MTDLPEINPRADRVTERLSAQLAKAHVEIAMLEDVVAQLQAERVTAANDATAPKGDG